MTTLSFDSTSEDFKQHLQLLEPATAHTQPGHTSASQEILGAMGPEPVLVPGSTHAL